MTIPARTDIVIAAKDLASRTYRRIGLQGRKLRRSFDKLKDSSIALMGSMQGLTTIVAGLGIGFLVKQTIDFGDRLDKLSLRLNASIEALSQYKFIAERSGVSFNTLTMAWQRMTRRVAEAAKGTGEARLALAELGLSAQVLKELKPEKQFEAIARAFQRIENRQDRLRIAMKLFDSEGVSLLQIINNGPDGIQKLKNRLDQLGGSFSEIDTQQMAKFNDALTDLSTSWSNLGKNIASHDIVSGATSEFASFIGSISEFFKSDETRQKELEAYAKEVEAWRERRDEFDTPFINSNISEAQFDLARKLDLTLEQAKKLPRDVKLDMPKAEADALIAKYDQEVSKATKLTEKLVESKKQIAKQLDIARKDDPLIQQVLKNQERFRKLKDQIGIPETIRKDDPNKDRIIELNTMINELHKLESEKIHVAIAKQRNETRIANLQASSDVALGWKSAMHEIGEDIKSGFELGKELAFETADAMTFAINDMALDAIEGRLDSFREYIKEFLKDIAKSISRIAGQQAVSHLFAGFGIDISKPANVSQRAEGGPVGRGKPYLVGELGPELFIPATAGNILPNNQLMGKASPLNVQVNVINNTSQPVDVEQDSQQISPEEWVLNVVLNAHEFNKKGFRDRFGK